jgi:ion channel
VLLELLTCLPVVLLCLLLQAIFVSKGLRYYARLLLARRGRDSLFMNVLLLSTIMLMMLLGNCAQMIIWAGLFMLIGEFDDFSTALYHSAVNFVTLGYGDIVMSEHWRLLGPLESANGILMFGVSTAVMTAAVMDIVKRNSDQLR